ncbi:hypothetical protein CCP3SC15_180002 [Gammaproteobacteria bacterium]
MVITPTDEVMTHYKPEQRLASLTEEWVGDPIILANLTMPLV